MTYLQCKVFLFFRGAVKEFISVVINFFDNYILPLIIINLILINENYHPNNLITLDFSNQNREINYRHISM